MFAGFADDAGRMPRTKGNYRERSDYSGGDARLGGGLSADPAGAAEVLVNGSMWGICTENARIRWLFTKFPAYSREEYRLDIRKAAQ